MRAQDLEQWPIWSVMTLFFPWLILPVVVVVPASTATPGQADLQGPGGQGAASVDSGPPPTRASPRGQAGGAGGQA